MTISSRRLAKGVLVALTLLPLLTGRASGAPQCPADSGARSGTAQRTLKLFAKDPATWKIVPHGAGGVLSFNEKTGRFSFSAERLEPLRNYSLVRHDEGKKSGDLLARGVTDQAGALSLTGTWRVWRGKVWLVPTDHTARSSDRLRLTTWRPGQYLFEEKVLGRDYPCNGKE